MPETGEVPGEVESVAGSEIAGSVSRRRFMIVAGGTAASGALLAACGDESSTGATGTSTDSSAETTTSTMESDANSTAEFGEGDLGILNYALTLEYLEAAFYADVVRSGLFKGGDLATIRTFGQQEADHVVALRGTIQKLGGKPAAKPKAEFPLEDSQSVLELAGTVENLGAAAYLGQAPRIKNGEVLAAALSIHSVEARHAAALNTLLGNSPMPDGPFAVPADVATVLDAVQPFIA